MYDTSLYKFISSLELSPQASFHTIPPETIPPAPFKDLSATALVAIISPTTEPNLPTADVIKFANFISKIWNLHALDGVHSPSVKIFKAALDTFSNRFKDTTNILIPRLLKWATLKITLLDIVLNPKNAKLQEELKAHVNQQPSDTSSEDNEDYCPPLCKDVHSPLFDVKRDVRVKKNPLIEQEPFLTFLDSILGLGVYAPSIVYTVQGQPVQIQLNAPGILADEFIQRTPSLLTKPLTGDSLTNFQLCTYFTLICSMRDVHGENLTIVKEHNATLTFYLFDGKYTVSPRPGSFSRTTSICESDDPLGSPPLLCEPSSSPPRPLSPTNDGEELLLPTNSIMYGAISAKEPLTPEAEQKIKECNTILERFSTHSEEFFHTFTPHFNGVSTNAEKASQTLSTTPDPSILDLIQGIHPSVGYLIPLLIRSNYSKEQAPRHLSDRKLLFSSLNNSLIPIIFNLLVRTNIPSMALTTALGKSIPKENLEEFQKEMDKLLEKLFSQWTNIDQNHDVKEKDEEKFTVLKQQGIEILLARYSPVGLVYILD